MFLPTYPIFLLLRETKISFCADKVDTVTIDFEKYISSNKPSEITRTIFFDKEGEFDFLLNLKTYRKICAIYQIRKRSCLLLYNSKRIKVVWELVSAGSTHCEALDVIVHHGVPKNSLI